MSAPPGLVTFTSSGPVSSQRVQAVTAALDNAATWEEADLIARNHGARFEPWPTLVESQKAIIETQDVELQWLRERRASAHRLIGFLFLSNVLTALLLLVEASR